LRSWFRTFAGAVRLALADMAERLSSLRWRLFLTYMLIGLVPLMFFAYTVAGDLEDYYSRQKSQELKNQANRIAGAASHAAYPSDPAMRALIEQEIAGYSQSGGYRVIIFDIQSIVVFDSSGIETGNTYVIPEVVSALNKTDTAAVRPGKAVMYAAVSMLNQTGDPIGAVLLIYSMASVNQLVSDMTQHFAVLAVLLGLITCVLVFFISQLLLDPLRGMLAVVQKISDGHLDQRVRAEGGREFSQLSDNFNHMAEQLEQAERSRQEFVSNVSHELKTPLSSIKVLGESLLMQEGAAKEMYVEYLGDIISEVDRMANIINELLVLVRMDAIEQQLNISRVRVGGMLAEIIKRLRPLADQKNISLTLTEAKTVVVDADEMKVNLAVSNIIENAVKYTESGGSVKVTADADHENAFITVADDGIGISEEDQAKVFKRFYRVDKTRNRETGGTGLGLSITQKTVLLHDGSIKLTSREGDGSTFVVRLPLRR
jgi:signal transduction histidine kinase